MAERNERPDLEKFAALIGEMDLGELLNFAEDAFRAARPGTERTKIRGLILHRAEQISAAAFRAVTDLFRELDLQEKKEHLQTRRESMLSLSGEGWENGVLERDARGNVTDSLDNYVNIMNFDDYYSGVRFNELKNAPEIRLTDTPEPMTVPWTDADEADSLRHIEEEYHIYSEIKHARALSLLWSNRKYNPIREIVDGLVWDGVPRVEDCLHRWLKCEDNPYTREVSRLIFAGGIHRLYNPGCKFDAVPVLVGTRQGEGKTTFVSWLAIEDRFKSDLITFEGTQAMEQLQGVWICEIAELIALTKLRDKETAKAFITRQNDKYRKPWAHNAEEYPRRCIFIGTTNSRRFLSDKTGNRRYFPVEVHSDGRDLRNHEEECREYILRCWAEARDRYRAGNMPACDNADLMKEFLAAQQDAMEDDWREGAIRSWLNEKPVGTRTCARQLAREALRLTPDEPAKDPTRKESSEICEIMDRLPGWERLPGTFYCGIYGTQRGWIKKEQTEPPLPPLPFETRRATDA